MNCITQVKVISTESIERPVNFGCWRNEAEMASHNLGLWYVGNSCLRY
jgi:hypothetical protein